MLKKIMSFVLVLTLIATALPVGVFAENTDEIAIVENDGAITETGIIETEDEPIEFIPNDNPDLEPDYEESVFDYIPEKNSISLMASELYSTISGTVVDESGKGISGVSVNLYDLDYREVVAICSTDAYGNWSCATAILGNDYLIRFHSPYYSFETQEISCPASSATVSADTVKGAANISTSIATAPANDFTYTVLNASYISITGYKGSATEFVIPNSIDGYTVQTIGASAFSENTTLKTVILPSTLEELGSSAFYGCTNLSYIGFNDALTTVGSSAFYGCTKLTSVDLPNSVTEVGNHSFYKCSNLEKVSLPTGLLGIYGYAFANCTKLSTIILPDSIVGLGYRAFYNDVSLTTINIPLSWTTSLYSSGSGYLFDGCTSLTSITVPEGITKLPDYAFSGCTYLSSIKLPETLETIGKSAFSSCTGLSSITLPIDLTFIDAYAFSGCTGLTSIDIPDKVYSIGYRTFNDCTRLSAVTLPSSWTSCPYNGGSGQIFSGCTALTSLTVPEGVTFIPDSAFANTTSLISIVLPSTIKNIGNSAFSGCSTLGGIDLGDGVSSIGDYAFNNCTALEDLILSDNLKTIGKRAFYNCTSLTNVSLPSRVTSIGEYAFYNTGVTEIDVPAGVSAINNYTFAKCPNLNKITLRRTVTSISTSAFNESPNVVIYCYNGSVAHNYAINNGIEYVILAEPASNGSEIDNNYTSFSGTDASGTTFTTKLYVYEYSTLNKLENVDINCSNGSLSMSLSGYNAVNIPNCTLKFGKKTKLVLIPESNGSFISAVHCNGQDALVNTLSISSEATTLDIYAYSTLSSSEIKEFQLMQDASVLQTSTTGKFTINPSQMTLDKPFSVRVVKADGTNCTKIKTNITVTDNIVTFDGDITIADSISFDVPDDIPLIGGGEVSLDFSMLPIAFEKEGDTFRIGLGCQKDLLENEYSWINFKKFIEKQDESLRKGINSLLASQFGTASAGMSKGFDMEVYGYVEGAISDSGEWRQAGGRVVINITGKVSQEWQTVVVVVPVVVKFSGEAGVNTVLSLGFDFNQAEMYFDGELELTIPKLTLSAGVGVAYIADISVYGSANNKIKLSTKTDAITATLGGEIGVSAKLLFASYKKALLKGSWQYYHSGARLMSVEPFGMQLMMAEAQNIDNYKLDRSYVYAQSDWLGSKVNDNPDDEVALMALEDVELMAATDNVKTLQTDVYYSANPQIVITDNGLKMMVWTADITTRTSGNHTAIVYSIYDDASATWSEPIIIEDDGTADFYPDVVTDGTNIYVVWMDSKNDNFTATSDLTNIAASCEITVAEYSSTNNQFTVSTLTDNTNADFSPAIAVVNDAVYVSWLGNSKNDILTLDGTNTIYYSKYANGTWSDVVNFATVNKPISEMNIGNVGGNAVIAYTLDEDNNVQTTEDVELYSGKIGASVKAITDNSIQEQNPQFGVLNGSNVLMWYSNGNLCYSTDANAVNTIDGSGSGFSPYFTVVDHNGNTTLLSIVHDETGSEINQYNVGETIGKPIELSSTGAYINSFSADSHSGVMYLPYTMATANITSLSVYESTDLCMMTVGTLSNVKIEDVSINHEDVADGATVPIDITVKNVGTVNETQLGITAKLNNSTKLNTTVNVDLPVGETTVVTVNLPLESTVTKNSNYTFTVTPKSGSDFNSSDNSKTLTIGYTDLQLTADKVKSEGSQSVLVTVENLSCIDTKATLRVREQTEDGNILATYYIGEIAAYGSETMDINTDILPELQNDGEIIYFEVLAVEDENFSADNYDFVYLAETEEVNAYVNVYGLAETVTFRGEDYDGKILVATYDESGRMLTLDHYTPENSIRISIDTDYAYAKVMWWDGLSSLRPKYDAIIVEAK